MVDEIVRAIHRLVPERVPRRLGEGPEVPDHVIGGAVVVAAGQALGGAIGVHVHGLEGFDRVDGFLAVVPALAGAPLAVGHQQGHGDVEIAVHGVRALVVPVAGGAVHVEAPVHEVFRLVAEILHHALRRTRTDRGQQAVEQLPRIRVMPSHHDREQHAVARTLRHGEVIIG